MDRTGVTLGQEKVKATLSVKLIVAKLGQNKHLVSAQVGLNLRPEREAGRARRGAGRRSHMTLDRPGIVSTFQQGFLSSNHRLRLRDSVRPARRASDQLELTSTAVSSLGLVSNDSFRLR